MGWKIKPNTRFDADKRGYARLQVKRIIDGLPAASGTGVKMKKIILAVMLGLITGSLFGESNDYFNKNKNIDILYVNATEGLRVRDSASLYSKKIGTLFDRMVVKVVSIGNEAEIDGIKSNWVQILLPIETINTGSNVYGWVFGGYLTENLFPFSTEKWSDADLQRYLSRFSWVSDNRYREFSPEGKYFFGLLESGMGGSGKYSVSIKNKTITLSVSYGDEEYKGPVEKEIYKILDIKEDSLLLEIKGSEVTLLPAFTNSNFWEKLARETMRFSSFDEPAMNALRFSFVTSMIKNLPIKDTTVLWSNLIKMGIKLDNQEFIHEYNKTWGNQ